MPHAHVAVQTDNGVCPECLVVVYIFIIVSLIQWFSKAFLSLFFLSLFSLCPRGNNLL